MARNYNHRKYKLLSNEKKNQIYLEDTIKSIMENKDYKDDDAKFNQINRNIDSMNTTLFYNNVEDKQQAKLQPINREDFDQFAKEYNNIGIANKLKRGAELITAFVIKIAPKVIGVALETAGNLIDLAGTATKVVGRNLPIGDIGKTANHLVAKAAGRRPLSDNDAPSRDPMKDWPIEHETLGAVSGVGKLVSELGSNIAGVGMAVQRATKATISSPTKRFAKKIKSPTQGK